MTLKTFHILATTPHGEIRRKRTLCGAAATGHDIRFGWQAFAVGQYEPCQECIRLRKEARRAAHVKYTATRQQLSSRH